MLFTRILIGWPATVYYLAFLLLHLFIGIGPLRLKLVARTMAIAYCCFGLLNTAVFYLAPGGNSRMQDVILRSHAMFPSTQPLLNQQLFMFDHSPFMIMGVFIGLLALLAELYFLISRKAAFEKAAAAR
jgi:hypothetical protein